MKFSVIILPTAIFVGACSTNTPSQSQNTGHIYLPVGAATPTQAMINSGDMTQQLKGFAILSNLDQPNEDVIKRANGTIDLGDDLETRDVTADIQGDFDTHAPDGFQFVEQSNNCLLICGYQLSQVATGTNGNKLHRRDDYYEQSYDYVMPFTYEIQGGDYYANGFVGVPTIEADINNNIGAEYIGEAKISMFDYGSGHADPFGPSQRAIIEADFGSGTMNLYIPEVEYQFANAQLGTPFKFYQVTGMTIDGNMFSGGQPLALDANNDAVMPVGSNSQFSTAGMFYGIDQEFGPDEVAGVINDTGDTTALQIEFIAD